MSWYSRTIHLVCMTCIENVILYATHEFTCLDKKVIHFLLFLSYKHFFGRAFLWLTSTAYYHFYSANILSSHTE